MSSRWFNLRNLWRAYLSYRAWRGMRPGRRPVPPYSGQPGGGHRPIPRTGMPGQPRTRFSCCCLALPLSFSAILAVLVGGLLLIF